MWHPDKSPLVLLKIVFGNGSAMTTISVICEKSYRNTQTAALVFRNAKLFSLSTFRQSFRAARLNQMIIEGWAGVNSSWLAGIISSSYTLPWIKLMKKDWPAHSALLSRVKGHFSPFSQAIPRSLESNGFPCALCYYWNESSILQWTKIENNQGSWRIACYMLKWYVFGTLQIKKEGYQIDHELLYTGHNCFVSTDVPCSVIMAECDDHGWVSKSLFDSSAFSSTFIIAFVFFSFIQASPGR